MSKEEKQIEKKGPPPAGIQQYFIPPEMEPGVYRAGVGMFVPGMEITLPDSASKPGDVPSLKLVPLNQVAYDTLVHFHGAEAVKGRHGPGPGAKPAPEAPASDVMTPKEAAALHSGKTVRAADR